MPALKHWSAHKQFFAFLRNLRNKAGERPQPSPPSQIIRVKWPKMKLHLYFLCRSLESFRNLRRSKSYNSVHALNQATERKTSWFLEISHSFLPKQQQDFKHPTITEQLLKISQLKTRQSLLACSVYDHVKRSNALERKLRAYVTSSVTATFWKHKCVTLAQTVIGSAKWSFLCASVVSDIVNSLIQRYSTT